MNSMSCKTRISCINIRKSFICFCIYVCLSTYFQICVYNDDTFFLLFFPFFLLVFRCVFWLMLVKVYHYYFTEYLFLLWRWLSLLVRNWRKPEQKTERRQNASQVCTFCRSFGKASRLATWAKTNIYYKNKSSPLNICKYFQGKYS